MAVRDFLTIPLWQRSSENYAENTCM